MFSLNPTDLLICAIGGLSLFLVLFSLFRFPVSHELPVHRQIAASMGKDNRKTVYENPILSPLMSFALALAQRFGMKGIRKSIRDGLNATGNPNSYSIDEYVGLCLASGVALSGGVTVIMLIFFFDLQPLVSVAVLLVGFYLPLMILKDEMASRLTKISKKLPYTLDLVALMMEAGSTFTEAVDTVIRDEPEDEFNQELAIVRGEIDFGVQRSNALRNMAERIPLDSLRSVVGAINQSESLGTPLSGILKSQSGMLRMQRSVRAEKLSASASLRILIPSMLILGAVCLVVLGPIIIQYINGDISI